jgi:hypothetical protein
MDPPWSPAVATASKRSKRKEGLESPDHATLIPSFCAGVDASWWARPGDFCLELRAQGLPVNNKAEL